MMDWYQIISYLFTNELRLLLGLFLVASLTGFSLKKGGLLLSAIAGCVVTILQTLSTPVVGAIAVEILFVLATAWYYLRQKLNLCLFLIFFYEVGVSLWDFLLQAGLGILFRSDAFLDPDAPEYLAGIWLVRLLMLAAAYIIARKKSAMSMRMASVLVLMGLFGTITLSEQTILPINEDQIVTWIILSMILLFAVLFYRLSRQREMELEIAKLKQEKAEILERDYQALRRTYSDNAKLYHDLHNHIEAIYQCLTQGDIPEAVRYCEDLRTPIQEISQTVRTGDKVIDYLINSKIALAEQNKIRTKVNPHNTNIRNADLTAILGNLLDNALEASKKAPDPLRFLSLTIRRINDMLIIKVENGCSDAPTQENGHLLTSKADKTFHGWGLKSVESAADRYEGTVNTEYKDGVFKSVVTLSFQPVKIG